MTDLNAQLTMTAGPVPGSIHLLNKAEMYLGRDLANDIPIPDVEISRRHARVFQQGELVFIEDLGSTNGTFVNGTRISSPKQLHHGDQITLAESTVFAFSVAGQPAVAQPAPVQDLPQVQEIVAQPAPDFQVVAPPVPERDLAPEPEFTKKPKKMSGFLIFLLIFLAIIIIATLVLVFMPTSWWCMITFNGLSGCPVR